MASVSHHAKQPLVELITFSLSLPLMKKYERDYDNDEGRQRAIIIQLLVVS